MRIPPPPLSEVRLCKVLLYWIECVSPNYDMGCNIIFQRHRVRLLNHYSCIHKHIHRPVEVTSLPCSQESLNTVEGGTGIICTADSN